MKNFIFIVLLFVQIYLGNGQLQNEKYYFIQSAEDNGYLRVATSGVYCEHLGTADTSRTVNRTGIEFRWKYSTLAGETYLEIDYSENQRLYINEVTNESYPPYCFNPVRNMKISPVPPAGHPTYHIQEANEPKHCLTSHGIGRRISWVLCDPRSIRQTWRFSPA